MKTLEEIKAEILASNPSRKYIINDEEFEQTDAEFDEAVNNRAAMEYEQMLKDKEIAEAQAAAQAQKQAILDRLGLTEDELRIVLG